MDESDITQNRRSRRSKVLLHAEIEAAGSVIAVKLRDLSVAGALIEGDRLPVEGTYVLLRRNELQVQGRVAWTSGAHAGLTFDVPIKPADVLRTIPPPRPGLMPKFRRPGLKHELSPTELQLIKIMADSARDLNK